MTQPLITTDDIVDQHTAQIRELKEEIRKLKSENTALMRYVPELYTDSLELQSTVTQTIVVPGDAVTGLTGTAWRVFYSDGSGDIQEAGLGSSGNVLTSNGASSAPSFQASSGGSMLKTQSGGYFIIPAGPAASTAVSSSTSADTYGSWTEMIASTAAAIYIAGFLHHVAASVTYSQIDIGTGAAASESSVGEMKVGQVVGGGTEQTIWSTIHWLTFPIPVATSTRIACRSADNTTSAQSHRVSLICINQSDLATI